MENIVGVDELVERHRIDTRRHQQNNDKEPFRHR
jgi:hypothetical protein